MTTTGGPAHAGLDHGGAGQRGRLSDHERRQLAAQWARRWPAAMVRSPYLTDAERRAARRRASSARSRATRAANGGRRTSKWGPPSRKGGEV